MSHQLVSQRELSEIVSDHLCFYIKLVPGFPSVALNHGADHFRDHNAVSEMCLDSLGFLSSWALLLGLAEFLQEALVLLLNPLSCETALLTGAEELLDFIDFEVKQVMELDASEH